MPRIFTWRINVRSYELNRFGYVSPATFLNYLEETAVRASAEAGYDNEWYEANDALWIIRQMTLRQFNPVTYDDELQFRSWVSDWRRVRSHREYDITRVRDEARVLRARADWIFINRRKMRPQRLFPQFETDFDPWYDSQEDLTITLDNQQSFTPRTHYTTVRRAAEHELDRVDHVNNAVYLRWIEDAFATCLENAARSGVLPSSFTTAPPFHLYHDIEYFQSAKASEQVTISCQPTRYDQKHLTWQCEIRRVKDNTLLVSNQAISTFLANVTYPIRPTGVIGQHPAPSGRNPRGEANT
jgi:acyl-CoA thioester hydrolase